MLEAFLHAPCLSCFHWWDPVSPDVAAVAAAEGPNKAALMAWIRQYWPGLHSTLFCSAKYGVLSQRSKSMPRMFAGGRGSDAARFDGASSLRSQRSKLRSWRSAAPRGSAARDGDSRSIWRFAFTVNRLSLRKALRFRTHFQTVGELLFAPCNRRLFRRLSVHRRATWKPAA